MRKLYIFGLIAIGGLIFGLAYAEQITFSTYYPAPYGVYNEMRARRVAIGSNYLDSSTYTVADDDLIIEGNLGIGTTTPNTFLEVVDQGALAKAQIYATSYSNNYGSYFVGRRARIDAAGNPIAVAANTELAQFGGRGHTGAGFSSGNRGKIVVYAANAWAPGNEGTEMRFYTTANGTTSTDIQMVIAQNGNVGIGEPQPQTALDVNGLIRTARYSLDDDLGGALPIAAATNRGAMFYNTVDDAMYYSDGSNWQPIGGAAAAFGAWTSVDTDGNPLRSGNPYLVSSDGLVCARNAGPPGEGKIKGYINPATAEEISELLWSEETHAPESHRHSLTMPVRNGDTWAIRADPAAMPIYWLPIGNGTCTRIP
jgi:hypothetical protein